MIYFLVKCQIIKIKIVAKYVKPDPKSLNFLFCLRNTQRYSLYSQ